MLAQQGNIPSFYQTLMAKSNLPDKTESIVRIRGKSVTYIATYNPKLGRGSIQIVGGNNDAHFADNNGNAEMDTGDDCYMEDVRGEFSSLPGDKQLEVKSKFDEAKKFIEESVVKGK